jgi:hypothetical protein
MRKSINLILQTGKKLYDFRNSEILEESDFDPKLNMKVLQGTLKGFQRLKI